MSEKKANFRKGLRTSQPGAGGWKGRNHDAKFASAMVEHRSVVKLRKKHVEDQSGKCVYCKTGFCSNNPATLEHIIPRSKGGLTTALNTCASCLSCNQERATANHGAFLRYKRASLGL